MLEFGARSTGDPLLDRSTNFVSSNTKPAKRCDKIGATPSVVRRVPMRRRSRAQQYPDLVSFLKGCGYNNRESEELQSRRNPGRTDCCRVSTNMRRAGPVDPFFDSGAWMREYAALPGRAGQRRGDSSEQGDFEKRMEDLHLDPSDQSKSTSPDRPPAGGGRAVRRDDFGGSMRAPPHSTFRESALGDTRRSVDIPSFQLTAATQVPQSSLRDDLFSSAR
ncbi:hypothetical protein AB7M17_000127 [Bradyrhizobium sp. USDA 377]